MKKLLLILLFIAGTISVYAQKPEYHTTTRTLVYDILENGQFKKVNQVDVVHHFVFDKGLITMDGLQQSALTLYGEGKETKSENGKSMTYTRMARTSQGQSVEFRFVVVNQDMQIQVIIPKVRMYIYIIDLTK